MPHPNLCGRETSLPPPPTSCQLALALRTQEALGKPTTRQDPHAHRLVALQPGTPGTWLLHEPQVGMKGKPPEKRSPSPPGTSEGCAPVSASPALQLQPQQGWSRSEMWVCVVLTWHPCMSVWLSMRCLHCWRGVCPPVFSPETRPFCSPPGPMDSCGWPGSTSFEAELKASLGTASGAHRASPELAIKRKLSHLLLPTSFS